MSAKLMIVRAIYGVKGLFEDPAELFRALGVRQRDCLLEVGCAIGYHTLALARVASHGKGVLRRRLAGGPGLLEVKAGPA